MILMSKRTKLVCIAGMRFYLVEFMHVFLAPSGIPYIVDLSAEDFSRIAIQWVELSCQDSNGEIVGYIVEYSSNSPPHSNEVFVAVSNNTRLVVDGLLPRTSYTFSVRAVGELGLLSHNANATTSTDIPSGQQFSLSVMVVCEFYFDH